MARADRNRTLWMGGAIAGAVLGLGGCQTVTHSVTHSVSYLATGRDIRPSKAPTTAAEDCSQGGAGCHPADRRQYYDDRTARYYYFDPATGRYYWENGDPRF